MASDLSLILNPLIIDDLHISFPKRPESVRKRLHPEMRYCKTLLDPHIDDLKDENSL